MFCNLSFVLCAYFVICALLFVIILVPARCFADSWLGFQNDPSRGGFSAVNFSHNNLKLAWVFTPTEKVWRYKLGASVWSSSVSIALVDGKDIVFAGLYNNNLYAIDTTTGQVMWRFIAGNSLMYAPFFAVVNARPMLFIASADRTIYALDAATGEKIWSYETHEWNYMISEAIASAPIVVTVEDKTVLICGMWNNSLAPFRNFQRGELFCLNAQDGTKIYSTVLSSSALNSPAFANINGTPFIFVSSRDGSVFGLDARNGKIVWSITTCGQLFSTPSVYAQEETARLFLGSRFGNLYCLDAYTGKILWTSKVGHAIDSTPAITSIHKKLLVYVGSYDRNVYAFDAKTGKELWRYKTGDYVTSSCILANVAGKPAVFTHSLDNTLYCFDAVSGSKIWSYNLGELIWGYSTRGDTLWASPAVAEVGAKSILVFPCYDGKLYAFTADNN